MSLIYGINPLARKRKNDYNFQKKKENYLSLVRNHLSGKKERKLLIQYVSSCYLKTLYILSDDKESLELKQKRREEDSPFLLFSFFPDPNLEKERKEYFSSSASSSSLDEAKKEIRMYNSFLARIEKKNCILSTEDRIDEDITFYDSHRRDIDSRQLRMDKPTCFLKDERHQIKIVIEKKAIIPKSFYDNIHQVVSFSLSVVPLKVEAPYKIRVRIFSLKKALLDEIYFPNDFLHCRILAVEATDERKKMELSFTLLTKERTSEAVKIDQYLD